MDFEKAGCRYGLDRTGLGSGQVAGCCECGDEPSGSTKVRGIPWLAEHLLFAAEVLCSMDLVSYTVLVYPSNNVRGSPFVKVRYF
jgi:hypothetical protein